MLQSNNLHTPPCKLGISIPIHVFKYNSSNPYITHQNLLPNSLSKQMQQRENKNNNNSEPLGICQRLINFITNTVGRWPNPPAPRSIEVPVEGSSVFRVEPEYYPGNSNSEIRVDFRHANGLENRVAKKDKATFNGEKGSIRPVESNIIRPTRIVSLGEVNGRKLNSISTGGNQRKPWEKMEGINGRGVEKENKNKDENTSTEAAAAAGGKAEVKPMILDFLEGDINGRADEFIKQESIKRKKILEKEQHS